LVELAPERAHALALDVTAPEAGGQAVDVVLERFGRVDVLVNNAGHGQVGAVEETTEEELREIFDVHVFGPAALVRAVLPAMRRQGSGVIVQFSSFGGQVAYPGFGAYCATKFALEGFSEALAPEVASFGIKVLIVEPGAFRTGFSGGALAQSREMPEYAETVGPTREMIMGIDGIQPGRPRQGRPSDPHRPRLGGHTLEVAARRRRRRWHPRQARLRAQGAGPLGGCGSLHGLWGHA